MLGSAQELKEDIKKAFDHPDISIPTKYKLLPSEWVLIPKVLLLLKPINEATLMFEGDDSCISEVIPIIKRLKLQLNAINERGVTTLKNTILHNIDNYLGGGDDRAHFVDIERCPMYSFATLLDPRYKADFFSSVNNAERAKLDLKDHCQNVGVSTPITADAEVPIESTTGEDEQQLNWEDCALNPNEDIGVGGGIVREFD